MDLYQANLVLLLFLCVYLFKEARQKPSPVRSPTIRPVESNTDAKPSQSSFYLVYALVAAADSLQAPHVYALYTEEHRIPTTLIPRLLITDIVSTAASDFLVGLVADRMGHKGACLIRCAASALGYLAAVVPSIPVMFIGKMVGGVSASVSGGFIMWLAKDFHDRGLTQKGEEGMSLANMRMTFISGFVGVASGLVSDWLVAFSGTRKTPFSASVVVLGIAFWLIAVKWDEKYDDPPSEEDDNKRTATDRRHSIRLTNPRVLFLTLAEMALGAATTLILFFWAPAVRSAQVTTAPLPYGVIFANFKASGLVGYIAYGLGSEWHILPYSSSTLLLAMLAIISFCSFRLTDAQPELFTLWTFCLFDAVLAMLPNCIGHTWKMLIDDDLAAQVAPTGYNPLRLFLVAVLLYAGDSEAFSTVFSLCSKLLFVSSGIVAISLIGSRSPPKEFVRRSGEDDATEKQAPPSGATSQK